MHTQTDPPATLQTATALGRVQTVNLDALPDSHLLPPIEAGAAIGIEPSTLAVWRSTGRYNLQYVKSGRKVFYRAGDLRAFLAQRVRTHTGQQ